MSTKKCPWSLKTVLEEAYHDKEWGVPIYDDDKLFQSLSLELCQSGLSWHTILKKREGFKAAFDCFVIDKVCQYDEQKIADLLLDKSIVRHKAKISAIVNNACCIKNIHAQNTTFSNYLWGFIDHKPIIGHWKNASDVPSSSSLSDHISKELKKIGFKFLGTTTVYAFMQSVGMVNDHILDCFRFNQCNESNGEKL